MPADVWAVNLAVGNWAHSKIKNERVETVSGSRVGENQDPTRGRMAGQERRIDDTILIREAQRGDRAAFEELVRHYDQAVLRLALHLTGTEHDAQDVYQDAFLKAYKNIGSFRFECSFYTWIYRIVTNLCLDHARRRAGSFSYIPPKPPLERIATTSPLRISEATVSTMASASLRRAAKSARTSCRAR